MTSTDFKDWTPTAALQRRWDRRDGRALMILLQLADENPRPWQVLALESGAHHDGHQVLDDHAHSIVGRYRTFGDAVRAAESYATGWTKNWKSTRAESCECGPVGARAEHTGKTPARKNERGRAS